MARIIRQYDPNETLRRITIEIKEDNCPGFLEFLSQLPYGHESSLLRAIAYQWFLEHQRNLDQAIVNALCGHGGRPDNRLPSGVKRVAVNLGQKVLRKTPPTVKLLPVTSTPNKKASTARKSVSKKSVVRHGKI